MQLIRLWAAGAAGRCVSDGTGTGTALPALPGDTGGVGNVSEGSGKQDFLYV